MADASVDGGGVGRFLGVHPAIKPDDKNFLKYDSSSEPEAVGRRAEQGKAMTGGAHFDEALACRCDIPCPYEYKFSGTDLLSGAPTDGDA